MKKTSLILGVLVLIGFASCKKSVNCTCTTQQTINGTAIPGSTVATLPAPSGDCSDLNTTTVQTVQGVEQVVTMKCVKK